MKREFPCIVEILTPKQDAADIEAELQKFADRFHKVLAAGFMVSVPDNPMGILHFSIMDVVKEIGLPIRPDQFLLHMNAFHTREDFDAVLKSAAAAGVRNLLLISGDGSERLPRMEPAALGVSAEVLTSVNLLEYVNAEYRGVFHCGVAYNPYEPQDHEVEKLRRKIAAGARYVITQPVIGRNEDVLRLWQHGLPVVVGAWMSKRLDLLSECVGYKIPEGQYDPLENVKTLLAGYPGAGLYLSLLGFKTQMPVLEELLKAGLESAEECDCCCCSDGA